MFEQSFKNIDDILHKDAGYSSELDTKLACRTKAELSRNISDKGQWPNLTRFMTDVMVRLEAGLKTSLSNVNQKLKDH